MTSTATYKLVGLAALIGIGASVTGVIFQNQHQKRMKETMNYKEAIRIFNEHPKAPDYLGKPVTEGRVKIGNAEGDNVYFSVALKGSNTTGNLYCEVERSKDPEVISELKLMEITFGNLPEKTFVILKK